jgi:tRNA dimethylallyltransferase
MSFAPTDTDLRAELEGAHLSDLVAELTAADAAAGSEVDLANRRRVVRAVEILRLSGETPSGRATTVEAEKLREYKPEIDFTAIGLDAEDATEGRLAQMRVDGLTDEVRGLLDRMGRTARGAVGYRELVDHLEGNTSEDDAYRVSAGNTKKLARRQRTWFRRDPRIRWILWVESVDERTARALEALS